MTPPPPAPRRDIEMIPPMTDEDVARIEARHAIPLSAKLEAVEAERARRAAACARAVERGSMTDADAAADALVWEAIAADYRWGLLGSGSPEETRVRLAVQSKAQNASARVAALAKAEGIIL